MHARHHMNRFMRCLAIVVDPQVARVLSVEPLEGSEKLYLTQVQIADGQELQVWPSSCQAWSHVQLQ